MTRSFASLRMTALMIENWNEISTVCHLERSEGFGRHKILRCAQDDMVF